MRPLTALTMTAGQTKTAADLLFHDRWVWLNNESPSNVTVKTTIGAINLPGYCSNLFDLCGDGGSPSLSCMAAVVLNYVNPPAVTLTGDIYQDTEKFILPPRGLVPLTRQVSIGNSIVLASSAQEIDSTYSGNATHPQIDTATPATGLGVQDQKASGYIELYPTATDATPRGIALGYIDSGGALHVGAFLDNTGILKALTTIADIPSTVPSAFFNATIPSTAGDINGVIDIVDNTASAVHWQIGKQSHANGDAFRIIDATNGKSSLSLTPNAGQVFIPSIVIGSASQFQVNASGIPTFIGNQATAGNFGVPAIVGESGLLHVTDTSAHTLVSFTPAADGKFRVSCTYESHNSLTATPNMRATFTDANGSADTVWMTASNPAGGVGGKDVTSRMDGSTVSVGAGFGAEDVNPVTFWAKSTGVLSVIFQEVGGGTVSDYVSATVERLA